MGFFRRTERVEDRALIRESTIGPIMVAPAMVAGEGVEARSAMSISSVWACVRTLCDASAMTPLHVYRKQADGARVQVESGQLVDLLRNPAPAVTGEALVVLLMQHLAMFGECFLGKLRTDGVITGLEPLDPARVTVEIIAGEPYYQYISAFGTMFEGLTTSDIIHVRGMSLDGVRGASPIATCREAMNQANALTTAGSSVWENSAVPSGMLRVSGPGAQDQAQSLADAWQARHGGAKRRGTIAVVTGEVDWQAISMSLADAEFVEQQKLSLQEVARIFGIPPSRLNAPKHDSLTYSTTLAEATAFVQTALAPRLKLIESAISSDTDLCSRPMYVEFALDGLLRGDALTRAQIYSLALGPTGWMTRAEVRRAGESAAGDDAATGAPGGRAGAERRAGAGDGTNERGGQVTDEVIEDRKDFTADERKQLADKGHALRGRFLPDRIVRRRGQRGAARRPREGPRGGEGAHPQAGEGARLQRCPTRGWLDSAPGRSRRGSRSAASAS